MTEALPKPATAPPLPMARAAGHPWAWHQVFAPGGYEWWHFDAVSDDRETLIAVDFFDGDPFDAEYRRRYERFVRRPTRTAPPLPAEYRGVSVAVYRGPKRIGGFRSSLPTVDFEASAERPWVPMGTNLIEGDGEGGFRLEMEGTGVRARLAFRASGGAQRNGGPVVHAFPPRAMTGAAHWWAPAVSTSRVSGQVELLGESLAFSGVGWMDHQHGLEPLGLGLERWMRGRVLGEQGCLAFMSARSASGAAWREERLVVRGDGSALSTASPLGGAAPGARESVGVGDERIELGEMTLAEQRVLESAGPWKRALYEVEGGQDESRVEPRGRVQPGEALCDIFTPRRRILGGFGF